jgi:hypothetical protein
MNKVEIFFRDLSPSKQAELLEAVGVDKPEDMNWDVFPLDTWDFEPIEEDE